MREKRVLLFLVVLLNFLFVSAQKGSIVGKITDKESNDEPLPFATVVIKGTTTGTVTDLDGLFQIPDLSPGEYTLRITFVGYDDLEIPDVLVEKDKVTEIITSMGQGSVQLDEVVVTAKPVNESEIALLLVQRKSVEIKQSIGAQELSRKGIGDAEGAVTNVTGVSKQDGAKNVVVRGLDDRYNSTFYNGLPLPSEDPEYKNIGLSYFTSDIIDNIEVNKTFSTSIYGDVGGANINIISKELQVDKQLEISLSGGYNSLASNRDFTRISGTNYLGLSEFNKNPISNLNQYDFENSFDSEQGNNPINYSLGIKGGKTFNLLGKELDAFLVASSSSNFLYREGPTRSNPTSEGLIGRDLFGVRYIQQSNQTLMANLGYQLKDNARITYNHLLIHTNSQNYGEYTGFAENISEIEGTTAFIRRQQVNDNTLLVNQLHYESSLTEKLSVDAGLGYNIVWGNEPDRRTNTFQRQDDTNTFEVASGSAGANHRFFSRLKEDDVVGKLELSYDLGQSDSDLKKLFRLGYNYRRTDRIFEYNQYAFATPGSRAVVDIDEVDVTFNQTALDNETFIMQTNRGTPNFDGALDPELYEGDRTIHSVFLNGTFSIGPKFIIDGGIRLEDVNQTVFWDFSQDQPQFPGDNSTTTTIEETYYLPSINLRYSFNEDNILRVAASQTYILPQFKEVSPFLYEDIAFRSFGNKDLRPSDVYNIDLKFDHFFSRSELISFGTFYKYIEFPINRLQVNSAGSDLSYVNTPDVTIFGAEVELRKTIINFNEESYLNLGANVSYLFSEQTLEDVDFDEITARFPPGVTESELQGASPLLVVGDLTYNLEKEDFRFTSTLLYSIFDDRINAIGTRTESIVGIAYPTLDFINRLDLNSNWSTNFSIKNILNPKVEESVGDVLLTSYRNGIVFSAGFTYKFF